MIYKNLNWQSHIKLVERKIWKNTRALFKVSLHLIRHAYYYFSRLYVYKYVSYIRYGIHKHKININKWKKKHKINEKNKHKKNAKNQHVVPIIFHEEKECYARPFLN